MNRTVENGMDGASPGGIGWLTGRQLFVDQLFAASGATSWGLPRGLFAAALERSASKRFGEESPGAGKIEEYLSALHLQDLALACACAEGRSDAWDHFVAAFRGYMRSAAGAILRCPPDSPAACELADSLFADLYGLGEGANRGSLFRYFHGRSSLKTWLRAVLAQRHIDTIRASRRFTDLEGEHESSVSRNLERTRRELRQHVERALRKGSSGLDGPTAGAGLSDEQIALCFEYAAEDAPIDLDKLLPESQASLPKRESRKP